MKIGCNGSDKKRVINPCQALTSIILKSLKSQMHQIPYSSP